MKLTLVGGGGVRGPLFVESCLAQADELGLDEIALLDIDEEHLALMSRIAAEMVRRSGLRLKLVVTSDAEVAIRDASYVVSTIRVGGDEARIRDERIALAHGVLGQETTGPGGLAMSMRTIPVALRLAEQIDRLAPGAWTFNFSNPAGLVTQALRDSGQKRVIGICDTANAAQSAVAQFLAINPDELHAEVFGLNHLSWCRTVGRDGVDLLQPLLANPRFRAATSLGLFEPELIELKHLWINEYLYYFYYADSAFREVSSAPATRGEEVRSLNDALREELRTIDTSDQALDAYYAYQRRRVSTYMPYERPVAREPMDPTSAPDAGTSRIGDGYAGVALTVIAALRTGRATQTALNVPNDGAIAGMEDSDVVEVSCAIAGATVRAMTIGPIPAPELALMSAVKTYERLAVRAIEQSSRRLAIEALMSHPLVSSYPIAKRLIDDYLAANQQYVGSWRD